MKTIQKIVGNRQLLNEVLGGFRLQGTNFTAWCRENGIKEPNARKYLLGHNPNGKKANEWRQKIIEAAQQPIKTN